LGIGPHFELWKYFFVVSLQKKREKNKAELSVLTGCASIHLWGSQAARYIPIVLTKSNKRWHKLWFYLENDASAPLSIFSNRLIEEAPPKWGYTPIERAKKRLRDLLNAVTRLRSGGVRRAGVVGAYHARGVAPLMVRALSLYEMTPYTPLEGMVLTRRPYHNSDIEQRIREAMDVLDNTFKFLILGHPAMRSDAGFIDLVSLLRVSLFGQPFIVI
jgi:hypothetical protein